VTLRSTRPHPRPFDAQMLAIADALMREFDRLPILSVIGALNGARRSLARPGRRPDPAAIAATARLRLLVTSRREAVRRAA